MLPNKEKTIPKWDLRPLIQNENEWAAIQEKIRQKTKHFTTYRKKLEKRPTREIVEQALAEMEEIGKLGSRMGIYASLRFAQNTQDEEAKALESRASQFFAEQGNQKIFFGIWWKNLDEKKAKKLLPKNKDYAYYLRDARRFKKYVLSEKEEQLSNLKNTTGEEALVRMYELITNAYTFEWTINGKTKKIGEEELTTYHRSTNPAHRIQSYDLRWKKYRADNGVLGEIYKNIALDTWNENISLRKYNSPISIRNMDNHLSDEMVHAFLDVCRKNTTLFQDYFQWKSKKLKIENSRYHVYAPLGKTQKKYSYEKAYAYVMDTFREFAPWFADEANRVHANHRMDAQIRHGKRGGAFCMDVPGEPNYVLLNYKGTLNDVSTLAHELGHAVHHQLAGHHSIFTQHAPLPLAETASIFSELLLAQKMEDESPNEEFTQALIAHQLDDAYASIQRQAFFCLFEQEAFQMIRNGKTIPELNEAYMKNLRTQMGKKMEIPQNAQYEWTAIPHFFEHPFYVYAYAFGQLLVYALYDRYLKEGKSFIPEYKRFLAYGGSKEPEKMLNEIGFDPYKRKNWQNGFDLLRIKLKTLQKMEK